MSVSRQSLPKGITLYDVLKTVALLLMIIDHLGVYGVIDSEWTRAFGRICVPIWMFLVGYAKTREIPMRFWVGMLILVGANALVGMPIFALNIIGTVIIVRLTIDVTMNFSRKSNVSLWCVSGALFLLVLPTYPFFEYGTSAIILAMFGYIVRHKETHFDKDTAFYFLIFAAMSYGLYQQLFFNFEQSAMLFMFAGTIMACLALYYFPPAKYTQISNRQSFFLRICGRYTLEIYVIHLVILKFYALFMGHEDFTFLNVQLFEPGVMSLINGDGSALLHANDVDFNVSEVFPE